MSVLACWEISDTNGKVIMSGDSLLTGYERLDVDTLTNLRLTILEALKRECPDTFFHKIVFRSITKLDD